ncbi:MAG: hypothetical protein GX606_05050 [Elusimicrobia bacterium]|nr:hypothetical protein [Elusimicrobiota bacterium]
MRSDCYGRQPLLTLMRKRTLDLKEGYRQNLALLGSLHVGKSTLLKQYLAELDEPGILPVYLDLENRDLRYFASKLVRSLLYHVAKAKGLPVSEDLETLIATVRPVLPVAAEEVARLQALVQEGKCTEAFEGLLDLPDRFTNGTGLFCVLILDEFQALEGYGVADIFKKLADRIMAQKNCLYIIASSFEEQARRILSERLTLLFGNFELVPVEPFDLKVSQEFIEKRMGGIKVGLQLRHFLSDFTGGRPLYLDLILQELTSLSATFRQQEIYTPLMAQAIENMLFDRWGALSRHFELIVGRLCSGRTNRLTMDILMALAGGHHRVNDMVTKLGAKKTPVIHKLAMLVDEDVVERNGTHFHVKDKLFRYWIKYVFQKRLETIELEPGRLKKEFKEEVGRAISAFHATSRRDLPTRVTELLSCFDREQLRLQGRRYELPRFEEIRAVKIRQRSGGAVDALEAQTSEGKWLLVLRKDPMIESDIGAIVEEVRTMPDRPKRCVIVSLSELDEAARLRALEERMWIWNEPEINALMNLFDKPYIVP